MARKVVTQLVDDLDGSLLEAGSGQTVLFALDGVSYEIDLSDENADGLREALSPYVGPARKTGRTQAGRATSANASRQDLAAIRVWAGENGRAVPSRGRIPQAVIDAYDAAH